MKKKIVSWKIEDIGLKNSQYFLGRSASFTSWDTVEVGIGSSAREAYDNALEGLAQEYDIPSDLDALSAQISDADIVSAHIRENFSDFIDDDYSLVSIDDGDCYAIVYCGALLPEMYEIQAVAIDAILEVSGAMENIDLYYHAAIWVKHEETEENDND